MWFIAILTAVCFFNPPLPQSCQEPFHQEAQPVLRRWAIWVDWIWDLNSSFCHNRFISFPPSPCSHMNEVYFSYSSTLALDT